MADLIDLPRALKQIPQAQTSDAPTVSSLITACSAVVEAYCQRTFTQATFDELHSFQSPTPYLFVDNPPISNVNWVRTTQLPACYVLYSDSTNQTQQATVEVTATAVVLKKIVNNTATTNSFLFTAYPTFSALGTAINTLGGGWTATVPSQFAQWQTSDMIRQGGYSARNLTAALLVYWFYLGDYRVERDELGEIYNPGGFLPGKQSYRVSYVGGYATIPDDLQQAVAELVQLTWATTRLTNPLMSAETIDKYSYTRAAETGLDQLSVASKLTIKKYRVMKIARYKS